MASRKTLKGKDIVIVECCRGCQGCSPKYDFRLKNDEIVTVLCGVPAVGVKYKAVSYLWGDVSVGVELKCRKCPKTKVVPMRDSKKLLDILEFVGGGCNVWLDALSVDQDDPKDKAEQIMVMGYIYRQAETTSVFLPQTDQTAYETLKELACTSDHIYRLLGDVTTDTVETRMATNSEFADAMETLVPKYLDSLTAWETCTSNWVYGSRAWTFQEWTRAAEIEITYEGITNEYGLKNIKNVVVIASSIVEQYRMQRLRGQPLTEQLQAREENGRVRNRVSTLFPFRNFLIADDEESPDTQRKLTCLSSLHSVDSGTYVHLEERSSRASELRSLLILALSSIDISKRNAKYEADLVACWASMCNIPYEYNPDDAFVLALHKVITALRQRGFRIYNFHVNTYGDETDLKFMDYAAAMWMRNGVGEPYFSGSPMLIGRVDTITHLEHCLDSHHALHDAAQNLVLQPSFDIEVRKLEGYEIAAPIRLDDVSAFLAHFRGLVAGKADGKQVLDVVDKVKELIINVSTDTPGRLADYFLVPVSITASDSGLDLNFSAWGIYHSRLPLSDIFIARESLNGTIILAQHISDSEVKIICYMNMTHQRYGTYLIKCDEDGTVDISFRKVDPDMPQIGSEWDLSSILADIPGSQMFDMPSLFGTTGDSFHPSLGSMEVLDVLRNVKVELGMQNYNLTKGHPGRHSQHRFVQQFCED
ncbi:hypothetical protein GLAREA_04004 [Glarea lozoyensis ATCC 20868]|uniref:Heterokaryon incompatibility domain-containing protein n=1 Tax=Glarea lozoyensis (strain ATCC 20868 / MF5171) TaxID=1116229 RepID=S3CXG8_GLAL2|nr:uncharacterized protein GLAREA_04004 [Glarea lozoyensis ATCC 20868]EPE31037.1 hypothetical protein GLAREA_04004 [Glarea lozoyensis ATCC 20868]